MKKHILINILTSAGTLLAGTVAGYFISRKVTNKRTRYAGNLMVTTVDGKIDDMYLQWHMNPNKIVELETAIIGVVHMDSKKSH